MVRRLIYVRFELIFKINNQGFVTSYKNVFLPT